MPEGDTLFRIAATLTKAIGERHLRRFESPLPQLSAASSSLLGQRIERIAAQGKNLLITFEDGRILRTHLRMSGSWHVYRPGEPWQKPVRGARVVLETDAFVAVCFWAPVVELLPPGGDRRHAQLSSLGPDLLAPDFDLDEALRRLLAARHLTLGEALLDQRIAAGIGNVYKSETLFLMGLDPFSRVALHPQEILRSLIMEAQRLLSQNLKGGPRVTHHRLDGAHLWVYGRQGEPCRRCGGRISMRRQGDAGRSTYYCQACQGVRL